jgi:hypothetical protein
VALRISSAATPSDHSRVTWRRVKRNQGAGEEPLIYWENGPETMDFPMKYVFVSCIFFFPLNWG